MKILSFFLFLWVIFATLNPDPDRATQINATTLHYSTAFGPKISKMSFLHPCLGSWEVTGSLTA
jgi:hypothetical protein